MPEGQDVPENIRTVQQEILPTDWEVLSLGQVATLQRGKDLPKSQRAQGPHPVVGSNGVVGYHSEAVAHGPGVLVGRSGSVGKATWVEQDYWPLNTALWVKDFHGNNPQFVYYLLDYVDLSKFAAGVSVPTLNRNLVHPVKVAVPHVPEQEAIAHVLRTIQKAIETTEQVIEATRELKRSLMNHLFTYGPVPVDEAEQVPLKETEIGPVPEHWDMMSLGEVATVGNGSTPKRTNPAYWDNGATPWITSGKVHETIIRQADEYVTEIAQEECHLPIIPAGSIVVAITGQGKTLGHAALVAFDTSINQHLAYLKFRSLEADPEFVLAYLDQRYDDLRRAGRAGGSTKAALTCRFLKNYPLPFPPLKEQLEVARTISGIDNKIVTEENRKHTLEILFKTLLHNLMTGKLRVKDLDLYEVVEIV